MQENNIENLLRITCRFKATFDVLKNLYFNTIYSHNETYISGNKKATVINHVIIKSKGFFGLFSIVLELMCLQMT